VTPDIISFTEYVMYELEYISECCSASPAMEMDMSTVPYGGPSGFCAKCLDNCIFIRPCYNCGDNATILKDNKEMYCIDCSSWLDTLGANGVYGRD